MCFRYNLSDTAFLKININNLQIGDRVCIVGRYSESNVNYYKVVNTDETSKACKVAETDLSTRPPYEELYCIRVDLCNYRREFEDRKDFDYVIGNVNTAEMKFRAAVTTVERLRLKDKNLYGKITLYIAEINEDGSICECAFDSNIIKQKFFLERA